MRRPLGPSGSASHTPERQAGCLPFAGVKRHAYGMNGFATYSRPALIEFEAACPPGEIAGS
jgi:hypothetical protein